MSEGDASLEWPLPFDGAPRLDVELDAEEVTLLGVAADVTPHVAVFGCEDENALHVGIEQHEGTTFVRITYPEREGWRSAHAHHVVLHVPHALIAFVRSWSGRVHASTLEGCDLSVETRAGEILARNVAGVLRLTTGAGRIDAQRVSGSLHVTTAVGAIRLEIDDLDPGVHRVRSTAGAVHVGLPRSMPVRLVARSNMGLVSVRVPSIDDARATLEVETHLGAVHVETTQTNWLPKLVDPYRG